MTLDRQPVVVTGATSGLGRALALRLGDAGARVVLVARGAEGLAATVAAIRARGGEAHAIPADVGADDTARVAATVLALVGTPAVVVHNASTLGPVPMPLLVDAPDGDVRRVFEVNVLGPLRLTRALLGPMLLAGRGLVVQVSSDAAVEAYPSWGPYGASKAAADHLIRTLAVELADTGVRFVAVDPGEMDTPMHAAALPDADRATLAAPDDVAEALMALIREPPTSGSRVVAEVPP